MGEARLINSGLNNSDAEKKSGIFAGPQQVISTTRYRETLKEKLNSLISETKSVDEATRVVQEKPIYLGRTPYNLSEKNGGGYALETIKGNSVVTYEYDKDLNCYSIRNRNTFANDDQGTTLDENYTKANKLLIEIIIKGQVKNRSK